MRKRALGVEPQTRLDRKRAERIAKIVRVAARLFATRGFESTRFEEIAAVLDLRGPSLYYYFASKEELFLGCVRQAASEVFERLRNIVAEGGNYVETLRRLFREQVLIELRDYPEFVPLFFRIYVPVPALREEILSLRREHAEIFEQVVRELLGRTSGPITEARLQLEIAFGALAYLPEWYQASGSLSVEELADLFADALNEPFTHLR